MTYSTKINCIDLEMELSRPLGRQIIEVGITVIDMVERKVEKTYSYPIKYLPEYHIIDREPGSGLRDLSFEINTNLITPEITALTGWTQRRLERSGELLGKVLTRLQERFGSKNRICVVDCWDEFKPFGADNPFGERVINISDLYRIKTRKFEGTSLEEMTAALNVQWTGKQHRANIDSRAIADCFLELIK